MTPGLPSIVPTRAAFRPEGRGDRGMSRGAFTIVELLVVIAIMIMLLTLAGAAVSGARASQKRQATQLLINKLDAILQQQFTTYASRNVITSGSTPSGMTAAAYRAWYIRRNLITGDLPDRWTDVAAIASGTLTVNGSGTPKLPITAPQRTYAAVWQGKNAQPSDQYAGAECLFMIVMQGGIANCLDCGELRTSERGDKDGDGFFEFWDAWENPIGFILWPAGLMLPGGSATKFFSDPRSLDAPFPTAGTSPSPGLGMRPLIYSAGPDGEYGFNRASEASQLTAGTGPVGRDCGNWKVEPAEPGASMAGPDPQKPGATIDNITNFDAELVK